MSDRLGAVELLELAAAAEAGGDMVVPASTVEKLTREVFALRSKVKEQQEALEDARPAAWEREEARD